jgi:cardiolipin synthase
MNASDPTQRPEDLASIAEISTLARASARHAAEIRILKDGVDAFPAMLALIEGARDQVLFENFIFSGDATGKRFAAALAAAARRGLDVRVLYDPIGSMMVSGGSIAGELNRLGVTARAFRPLFAMNPLSWVRLLNRDHRKALSVDAETAVVGGLCISDNWAPASEGGAGWRDTALLVRGPIAADVRAEFEAMWQRALGATVASSVAGAEAAGGRAAQTDSVGAHIGAQPTAWVVIDEPGIQQVWDLYAGLTARARRSIEITGAYLVLQRSAQVAFCAAARRGIRVRMLLPGRNNHPLAGAAARNGYEALLEAGVEIYEWNGAMIHAKTAVFDGELALVGSSNLDPLSTHRNFELNLLVADRATGAKMSAMFERDLARATRIELASWRRRPRWQRLAEATGALFGSHL